MRDGGNEGRESVLPCDPCFTSTCEGHTNNHKLGRLQVLLSPALLTSFAFPAGAGRRRGGRSPSNTPFRYYTCAHSNGRRHAETDGHDGFIPLLYAMSMISSLMHTRDLSQEILSSQRDRKSFNTAAKYHVASNEHQQMMESTFANNIDFVPIANLASKYDECRLSCCLLPPSPVSFPNCELACLLELEVASHLESWWSTQLYLSLLLFSMRHSATCVN